MVYSQESSPPCQLSNTLPSTSCRFGHLSSFQKNTIHPAFMPQPQDLNQHATDFSHQISHPMLSRSVEDWLSNVYYPGAAHTLPSSMYHNRYNPYQRYDYRGFHQNLQQYAPTPSHAAKTSPVPSFSPDGSIGSISPPNDQTNVPYDWMKPASSFRPRVPGKTRTKDKYRVVYSDLQRLELEKEFHFNKFITLQRKSELAQMLNLSDRQVKIWFQNRRAKERRQKKTCDSTEDTTVSQLDQLASLCDSYTTSPEQKMNQSLSLNQSPTVPTQMSPLNDYPTVPTQMSPVNDYSDIILLSPLPWKDTSSSDSDCTPSYCL